MTINDSLPENTPTNDARPDAASFNGVIVIDKPLGPTSMRVVERVRRAASGARCGHAGTLDPLATGVLVVALGRATREIDRLMAGPKRYETEIDLSATTATLDSEGERQVVDIAHTPSLEDIDRALAAMRGTFAQTPPAFSAVKIGGRRAYALARRGHAEEPPPRQVTVHELAIEHFAFPIVRLRIRCEKGFYVRSLARDLGRRPRNRRILPGDSADRSGALHARRCHSARRTAICAASHHGSRRNLDMREASKSVIHRTQSAFHREGVQWP